MRLEVVGIDDVDAGREQDDGWRIDVITTVRSGKDGLAERFVGEDVMGGFRGSADRVKSGSETQFLSSAAGDGTEGEKWRWEGRWGGVETSGRGGVEGGTGRRVI